MINHWRHGVLSLKETQRRSTFLPTPPANLGWLKYVEIPAAKQPPQPLIYLMIDMCSNCFDVFLLDLSWTQTVFGDPFEWRPDIATDMAMFHDVAMEIMSCSSMKDEMALGCTG